MIKRKGYRAHQMRKTAAAGNVLCIVVFVPMVPRVFRCTHVGVPSLKAQKFWFVFRGKRSVEIGRSKSQVGTVWYRNGE